MKKINRSKLVLAKDVVRVLGNRDLGEVAGARINLNTVLGQCVTIDGYTCWDSCIITGCH